jgi:hypothetical protein
MAKPITVFLWGYYGWGPHGKDLLRLSAAVELARGFKPPVFVDIRVRRSGRARDFNGPAFERMASNRYAWIRDLGNQHVIDGRKGIKIRRPEAAEDLLDLAIRYAKRSQRLIVFCSCGPPCGCHRVKVGDLLLKAAQRRGIELEVIEWPGGSPNPRPYKVDLEPGELTRFRKHGVSVYLPKTAPVEKLSGLPVGSIIKGICEGASVTFACYPAQPLGKRWYLDALLNDDGTEVPPKPMAITKWRRTYCYAARRR